MRVWKQLLISLGVLAAGVLLWGRFVPGANGMLEAAGLPGPLVAAIAPAGDGKAGGDNAGSGAGGGQRGGFGGGPALVVTKPVTIATVNDRLNAIGDGEAIRSVTVTPYATGNLTEVLVESGQRVEQGGPARSGCWGQGAHAASAWGCSACATSLAVCLDSPCWVFSQ